MTKIPPHALDLEEAVLGAIMIEKRAFLLAQKILEPKHFYDDKNRLVYATARELFTKGMPVDILTVTENLRKKKVLDKIGGAGFITRLTSRVASAANIEAHSQIIKEKFISRKLIEISTDAIQQAFDGNKEPLELLSSVGQQLLSITANIGSNEVTIQKSIKDVLKLMEDAAAAHDGKSDKEPKVTGIPTGFRQLDEAVGGWMGGELIIIAARPSMGKTSMALIHASEAAKRGKKVHIQSYEMRHTGLTQSILSQESLINRKSFKNGEALNNPSLQKAISQVENYQITIDPSNLTSVQLHANMTVKKMTDGLDMLVVDYLQLMPEAGKFFNEDTKLGFDSKRLKAIAKELDIPVIALCQLSRQVESRPDKKPNKSDLRGSGNIEQDADIILSPFRPAYYKLNYDDGRPIEEDYAEYLILKQREGALAEIPVGWDAERVRYYDPTKETKNLYDSLKPKNYYEPEDNQDKPF